MVEEILTLAKDFIVLESKELKGKVDLGRVIMQVPAIQIAQRVYLGDKPFRPITKIQPPITKISLTRHGTHPSISLRLNVFSKNLVYS